MSLPDLTDEQQAVVTRISGQFDIAETEHRTFRKKADGFWRQYHAFQDYKRSWDEASPRDKDFVLHDGRVEFGARLYLPYAFAGVETIVPRMLAHRPRMLFLPADEESHRNTENVRWLMDRQQQACNYELSLHDTAKNGLVTGLGIRKTYWRRSRPRQTYRLGDAMYGDGYVAVPYSETDWDDPWSEDIDPYDFLWVGNADSVEAANAKIHRLWRPTTYVLEMLRTPNETGLAEWDFIDGSQATAEDLQGGGKNRYDTLWAERRRAQGYGSTASRECLHEIWEYHGGGEIVTVLDRQWPVRVRPNMSWHGRDPFSGYRPVKVSGRMVGKSVPEMVEQLEAEMNTFRSMRLDNATLVMQRSFFYEDGAIDPQEMNFGPGMMHGVRSQGSLRDALVPIDVGEIPYSSYREIEELHEAIERTTGVSDQAAGAAPSGGTATEAQLVQQGSNARIALMTRRLELEACKSEAEKWVRLNQQHIIENRTVRIPQIPQPGVPDAIWAWREVGPAELAGTWDIEPEGGASAPENIPQDRSDAEQATGMFMSDPSIDQRKMSMWKLEKMGIRRPESYMVPEQFVPPETLNKIAEWMEANGLQPDAVQSGIRESLQAALTQSPEVSRQRLELPQAAGSAR